MIKYFQETQDGNLTLKINDTTMADLYDDADFAVHADMKSRRGGVLTTGKGAINKSINQKINQNIST